jgi:hypothetical protein
VNVDPAVKLTVLDSPRSVSRAAGVDVQKTLAVVEGNATKLMEGGWVLEESTRLTNSMRVGSRQSEWPPSDRRVQKSIASTHSNGPASSRCHISPVMLSVTVDGSIVYATGASGGVTV